MNKHEFSRRLAALRINKGVSARDMSLSIGQSAGYINNIENGINLPSMQAFFYICEYLERPAPQPNQPCKGIEVNKKLGQKVSLVFKRPSALFFNMKSFFS